MFVMKKDTQIADILELAPEVIPLFSEIGMHCIGCALSSEEKGRFDRPFYFYKITLLPSP